MRAPTDNSIVLSKDLQLEQIIPLKQVAKLRGTSIDTVRRHDREHIIQLSPRRQGMKLKHALRIG